MDDYNFSVIITAYNIQEYIEKAIHSVLEQSYSAFEIIVVDDGSVDETANIAIKALTRTKNSQVFRQKNKGPGGARNRGIAAATGDYLVFLDGDDWILENALEIFNTELSTGPDAIFSNRCWFYEKSNKFVADNVFTKSTQGPVVPKRELLRRYAVPGKAFKREFLILNQIFFPEGMVWEDYPFSYNVLAKAENISVIIDVTYVARKRHGVNQSMTQKRRLGEFFLQSRFRQIDMDRSIIKNSSLPLIFKNFNFDKMEFDNRLMKDVIYLEKEKDDEIVLHALKRLKNYIFDNQKIIMNNVSMTVEKIYTSILAENLVDTIKYIQQHKKKN